MDIICPTCNHNHHFDVDVTDFKGFVCSSCSSYFKGNYKNSFDAPDFQFVHQFPNRLDGILPVLNEALKINNKTYRIITILVREGIKNGSINYEYVALDATDSSLYYSHGHEYFCKLIELDEKAIKRIDEDHLKYNHHSYAFEESLTSKVTFAEGFVFEDLTQLSTARTYEHSYNEDKFVSEEVFDGYTEYYSGTYLEANTFKKLFKKVRDTGDVKEQAQLLFVKLSALAVLITTVLFILLNFNNLFSQKFTFDEQFTSTQFTNQFIGQSFKLKGTDRRLIFDGISETNEKDVNLKIHLVNEKTNQVQESIFLNHYDNDINFASGITIDFCKVEAGIYHLVFETVRQSEVPMEYKIDYRLKFGEIDYMVLFIGIVLLVILCHLIYKQLFTEKEFYLNYITINYKDILTQYYFGYLLLGFILIFSSYIIYSNYFENCTSSTAVNVLEDHTYTGSRSHYYRVYSSDGTGHK